MNLSRKEFFLKGIRTLGQAVLNPAAFQLEDRISPGTPLRPPGFVAERCKQCGPCGLCIQSCPEGCLNHADGVCGPVFIPRLGQCTFCGDCAAICPKGVIQPCLEGVRRQVGRAVPDNSRCLAHRGGCFACIEHCPEEAIVIKLGQGIGIDKGRCTGCGACEKICPLDSSAVRVEPLSVAP